MKVIKRSDKEQALDIEKISDSIFLAAQDAGGTDDKLAHKLAKEVVEHIEKHYGRIKKVTSAEIGDMVERVLLEQSHYKIIRHPDRSGGISRLRSR